jgi:hypothetical protein
MSQNGSSSNGHAPLPLIHFEDLSARDASDSSNRRYHKPPSEYNEEVWHLGWTDGRCGQPAAENEAILRARGRLRWRERASATEAEVGAARALVQSLQGSVSRLRERVDEVAAIHLALLREKGESPQSFSKSLWIIYSVVAFLLLAADLPLSLKLVAMGYGVKTENRIDQRSVDDLLKFPGYVITEFWEAMLLALGIALAGVFVKYFLDAVLYREEQKGAARTFKAALTLVFALFVGTTIFLGIFRADVQRQKNIEDLSRRLTELQRIGGNSPSPEMQRALANVDSKIKAEEAESWTSVRSVSFIALTLLFPITGGICFSVGWRKFVKFRSLNRAARDLRELEQAYGAELLRFEQASAVLESQQAKRDREAAAYASADDYADMLVGLYRHGYQRGLNVPETLNAGEGLYERCEKAVQKLLAGKLRDRYWEHRPPGAPGLN